MKTIREVFGKNIRILRGKRTQAEMAELLDIPLRSYQHLEAGQIPQEATMQRLTQKLGVSEVSFFQDASVAPPTPLAEPSPSAASLLELLRQIPPDLNHAEMAHLARQIKVLTDRRSKAHDLVDLDKKRTS